MKHFFKRPIIAVSGIFVFGLILLGFAALKPALAQPVAALPDASQPSVSTNLGVYGGDTWDIAVDGNYVYAIATSTPNGFFYSTDAGATWQRLAGTNDYGSGQGVEVDYTTGTVWVSLGGDLYKSTDHGATLTLITADAGFPLLFGQGKVLAAWNDIIKISADNGATFSSVKIDANADIGVRSLAAGKTSGTFYATTYAGDTATGKLYKSTDGGATWSAISLTINGVAFSSFYSVSADPYDENKLVVANDHHLWLSSDAGATFTEINHNCNTISTWTASGRWYACSAYSDDNGSTWTDMDIHTNVVRGPGKVIAINPQDANVMYGDCMSGVCKSTDAGLTWTTSYQGITAVNIQAISVTTDKTTAWASSGNGLAKSTNFNSGTPTWQFPVMPCAPERCDSSGIGQSIWVKPDDPNIVLAGSIGGFIYRSADAGATWILASHPTIDVAKYIDSDTNMNLLRPQMFINDPNNSSIVYVALSGPTTGTTWIGVVLKSTDSGTTWTDLALPDDAPAVSLAISKTGVMYVGTGASNSPTKGVYKLDSGAWTKLTGIPTDVNINSILIDPENESTLYVVASGDARLSHDGFYKSVDAGATWKMAAGLSDYYNFDAVTIQRSTTPNTLYVSCRDKLWHGVLLKSSDAGETWGVLYQGLKSETFNTVVFDGLVAGSKHGVFGLHSRSKFINLKLSASKVKKGKLVSVTGTLRDAATKLTLKNKVLGMYQQNGKKWQLLGTIKTNNTGAFTAYFRPVKNSTYIVTWIPNKTDRVEYVGASILPQKLTVIQ